MDNRIPVFKLQVIAFLDSLCFGLIYGFISPYILSLGADHVVVGIMAVGNLICSLLSTYILDILVPIQGKRFALFLLLNAALASHILLILTNSYWFTIFARYIYSLTIESKNVCRDLLLQRVPNDEKECFLKSYNIINGAGFVIGPFISGFIFATGFGYIGLLAAVLTFINIYLLMTVAKIKEDLVVADNKKGLVEQVTDDLKEVVQNFKKSDYEKNWDVMALKYLYISSTIIFFSKFTQILKNNFNSNAFVIGYTSSYMNLLSFVAAYYVGNMKEKYNYSARFLMEYALVFLTVSLLFICYSSFYIGYATIYIPLIFLTSYMNTVWKELFSSRSNDSLVSINNAVGIAAGLTSPIFFGIICNIIGHHAVILLTVLPIVSSLFIFNKYTKKYKSTEEDTKQKDD